MYATLMSESELAASAPADHGEVITVDSEEERIPK
jgi:hypothetical protein